MTNILRIPASSYAKSAKILSDQLESGTLDMIIFTHEPRPNLADPESTPEGPVDGVCLISAYTARFNPGFAGVVDNDNGSGQMVFKYTLNSIPYYLPEFGSPRFVKTKEYAVDDAGLIDMVAFSPKDLEKLGYDPQKFNFVRDVYTQGPEGAAMAAVEPGSRMIVTGPASGDTQGIVGATNVVVGPKDLAALQTLFALAAKHSMSVTELVNAISEDFDPSAKSVPGHPVVEIEPPLN